LAAVTPKKIPRRAADSGVAEKTNTKEGCASKENP